MSRFRKEWGKHAGALLAGLLLWSGGSALASGTPNAFRQVALGENHYCAVTHAGALACWGDNRRGQIGGGVQNDRVLEPVLVLPAGVQQVAAGYAHTCAVLADGVSCWGWNHSGQLGTGVVGGDVPKPTRAIAGRVSRVATGAMHTCALVEGALQCWGSNLNGQLGLGKVGGEAVRPRTVFADRVSNFAAGGQHSCAIVRDDLFCWGDNRHGQVGNGETGAPVPQPVRVIAGGVKDVAAGPDYTCAVLAGGALKCWGKISAIGIGPNGGIEPRPILTIDAGVTAVAAGTAHACAVVRGALHCWGYNAVGSVGTGKWGEVVATPRMVIPAGVTTVAAGALGTCAIVQDALRCRGGHAYAEVPAMKRFLSESFALAGGDVRELDVAAAALAAVGMGVPGKVPQALQGRIVVASGSTAPAAYYVAGGSGSTDVHGRLSLQLDVFPLVALEAVRGAGGQGYAFARDVRCGAGLSGMPVRLDEPPMFVLEGPHWIRLQDALMKVYPVLPTIDDPGPAPQMEQAALAALRACVDQLLATEGIKPFRAIRYQTAQGTFTVPPSLDGWWSPPSMPARGQVERILVEPRPGQGGVFTVQAGLITELRCGDVTLSTGMEAKAAPWIVSPGEQASAFELDRRLLDADTAPLPRPSSMELRKALQAAQGGPRLPDDEAVRACGWQATGEEYWIRHHGQLVQRFGFPYPTGKPLAPAGCDGDLPMAALHVANSLGYPVMDGHGLMRCKPLPDAASRHLVALAFPSKPAPSGGGGPQDGSYDLDVLVTDSASGAVVSRLKRPGALSSDAFQLRAIDIDTARYRLTPQARAFGIRVRNEVSSRAIAASTEKLDLYLPRGGRLLHVLEGLVVHRYGSEPEGECAGTINETARTLAVGRTATRGYADLVVTTTITASTLRQVGEECQPQVTQRRGTRDVVRHDGTKYVVPPHLREP